MTTAVMFVSWPVRTWTQAGAGSSAGMPPAGLIVIAGLLVFAGAFVVLFDFRRKRETEAASVQAQISDAMLRSPTPFGVSLTPTVRVPFWKGFAGRRRGVGAGAVRRHPSDRSAHHPRLPQSPTECPRIGLLG